MNFTRNPADVAFETLLAAQGHLPAHNGPVGVYLSADGDHVTDFHGTVVGVVLRRSRVQLTRLSYTHGRYITAVRVKAGGRMWYGRGGCGLSVTLRPVKGA